MDRAQFVQKLVALGFEFDFEVKERAYYRKRAGLRVIFVSVEQETAYASYDYGGDTGPIEITDPVGEPFDIALDRIERGW